MSSDLPSVFWFAPEASRPLCDIPWHGTAVVLADGTLNFCCHSNASPGNVNERTFNDLWNGSMMQRVRETLSRQEYPPECSSAACPIYRGDEYEYVRKRVGGTFRKALTGTEDPHRGFREAIAEAELQITPAAGALEARLSLSAKWSLQACDVVAGVRLLDGTMRFFPDLDEFPVPCARLDSLEGRRELKLETGALWTSLRKPGSYELCVGLFVPESNPAIPSNCFWAMSQRFLV